MRCTVPPSASRGFRRNKVWTRLHKYFRIDSSAGSERLAGRAGEYGETTISDTLDERIFREYQSFAEIMVASRLKDAQRREYFANLVIPPSPALSVAVFRPKIGPT